MFFLFLTLLTSLYHKIKQYFLNLFQQSSKNDKPIKEGYEEIVIHVKTPFFKTIKSEKPGFIEVDGEVVGINKIVKEEFFSNEEINIMDVDIKHSPSCLNMLVSMRVCVHTYTIVRY